MSSARKVRRQNYGILSKKSLAVKKFFSILAIGFGKLLPRNGGKHQLKLQIVILIYIFLIYTFLKNIGFVPELGGLPWQGLELMSF